MTTPDDDVRARLDVIVRRGRGRLVADLVRRLGGGRLDLAEDVAQDALAAAIAAWPFRGVPDNPEAWLFQAARNRALDRLRRETRETAYAEETDDRGDGVERAPIDDPELRLIFLCCHPTLDEKSALCLTLKIVDGFTARETAGVFLEPETATAQRLARAKRALRDAADGVAETPSRFEIAARAPRALKVVYLMFALGYAPRAGERALRRDVASEALRLARVLADHPLTKRPEAAALAALLSFQASRFEARESAEGAIVLLKDQDRALWDGALIRQGLAYLEPARTGEAVSRYHLEAGVAATHATARSFEATDWPSILTLYETLLTLTPSPVAMVNAAAARAAAGDPTGALEALDALSDEKALATYAPYHIARADALERLGRAADAGTAYAAALEAGPPAPVVEHLEGRLAAFE
ncbi:MAG: DUF6596 domain-containing protein [Pseudomonadota bacterium]